jgi:hypothetical protein
MGFLDKAKDVAGKSLDKAKDLTAQGKEKVDDIRLQKKIDELCEEIGKLVVSSKRGEGPTDADAQIDAKVEEIANIEKQMEENNVKAKADADAAGETPAADAPAADAPAATEEASA